MPDRCIDSRLLQGQVRSCAATVRDAVARQPLPRFFDFAPAWPCVSVLAKDKTNTERLWRYARDDQSFSGSDSPTAAFFPSRDWRATVPAPCEPKIDIRQTPN
jgi:hypothetical protein